MPKRPWRANVGERRPTPRPRSAPRRSRPGRLRLRWATVRDVPTLARHRRRMWEAIRNFSASELDRHDVVYRRWVRGQMRAGKFFAVVVDDLSGEPVGSGGLWLMPSQPRPGPLGRGEMPYVLSMYTEPEHRGRGVASRIVREMIRWSKARRYGRIVLHASRFGRPVYERLGFEPGSEMRLALDAEAHRRRRSGRPRGRARPRAR